MEPVNPIEFAKIAEIRNQLKTAERLLFITGAGISAESGLPTYRGVGGLYNGENTEDGLPIEVMLSGTKFQERPSSVWKYLSRIEAACRGANPNQAHLKIAEIQNRFDVVVLTQNVDGLHSEAGSSSVIEIHGNMYHLKCTGCRYTMALKNYTGLSIPPECPDCGSMLRPDVVLFGERLDSARLYELQAETYKGFDMVLIIGTTAVFPYIADPVISAVNKGIPTVEINPSVTSLSEQVMYKLTGKAGESLMNIFENI